MSPFATGFVVFACLFASAMIGMRLRTVLPEHHLSAETKDTVRVAMGLVATMAALLLGLLVAAAKGTYDEERTEVVQAVARVNYLDGVLQDYGPDALPVRKVLRRTVEQALIRGWPDENPEHIPVDSNPSWSRELAHSLATLAPEDDNRRALKAEATELTRELGQIHWLITEQARAAVSRSLLVIVVVWMAMIFISLGVFAPPNATIRIAFGAAALSVAGATFLILEFSRPFDGLMRISSAPLRWALAQLPS